MQLRFVCSKSILMCIKEQAWAASMKSLWKKLLLFFFSFIFSFWRILVSLQSSEVLLFVLYLLLFRICHNREHIIRVYFYYLKYILYIHYMFNFLNTSHTCIIVFESSYSQDFSLFLSLLSQRMILEKILSLDEFLFYSNKSKSRNKRFSFSSNSLVVYSLCSVLVYY